MIHKNTPSHKLPGWGKADKYWNKGFRSATHLSLVDNDREIEKCDVYYVEKRLIAVSSVFSYQTQRNRPWKSHHLISDFLIWINTRNNIREWFSFTSHSLLLRCHQLIFRVIDYKGDRSQNFYLLICIDCINICKAKSGKLLNIYWMCFYWKGHGKSVRIWKGSLLQQKGKYIKQFERTAISYNLTKTHCLVNCF